jgi:hypothetical protein
MSPDIRHPTIYDAMYDAILLIILVNLVWGRGVLFLVPAFRPLLRGVFGGPKRSVSGVVRDVCGLFFTHSAAPCVRPLAAWVFFRPGA